MPEEGNKLSSANPVPASTQKASKARTFVPMALSRQERQDYSIRLVVSHQKIKENPVKEEQNDSKRSAEPALSPTQTMSPAAADV
ncbi:hypothetical protein CPB84DRAFT_1842179 [Gymnopilus junonius]|uniref:Uncharacterized protein n=1 Tax=Gymnopilus junonius TaxID=109634 RepID=A0A9P5P078_GYMJU|nr:hypothetical protein CPB84DRAFT_1842179 [Gymnopilus junonius]